MTNQSIDVDEIVNEINNGDNHSRTLAEMFIEVIRPYNLNDTQAVHLFSQVKNQMSKIPGLARQTANYGSSWTLLSC